MSQNFKHLILIIMGITSCLLNHVSSFSSTDKLPRLNAEMAVHKYEERLRFEKKVSFSPKMVSHITENLLKFCKASCENVNEELTLSFIKAFGQRVNKTDTLPIRSEERFYTYYEKAFSNCLMTRYIRSVGLQSTIPEPEMHIFHIPESDEPETTVTINTTMGATAINVFPIESASGLNEEEDIIINEDYEYLDEDMMETDNNSNAILQRKKNYECSSLVEDFNFDGYALEAYLNCLDAYDENLDVKLQSYYDIHSECTVVKVVDYKKENVNRLMNFFKTAVALFYDRCAEYYNPYANFWQKYILGLQNYFEQSIHNVNSVLYYLDIRGLSDELLKCSSDSLSMDLFARIVEIGKIFEIE